MDGRRNTIMRFLVELDHINTGRPFTEDTARAFIEGIIVPTLARAEQLAQEGRIVAGGAVAGRVALRFIADVETSQQLDRIVASLPLWTVADTRVTPLIDFGDRRAGVRTLLQRAETT
jgi:muconolactone delta-isomerase